MRRSCVDLRQPPILKSGGLGGFGTVQPVCALRHRKAQGWMEDGTHMITPSTLTLGCCETMQECADDRCPVCSNSICCNSVKLWRFYRRDKGRFSSRHHGHAFPPPCPTSVLSAHSAEFLMDRALFFLQPSCSSSFNLLTKPFLPVQGEICVPMLHLTSGDS